MKMGDSAESSGAMEQRQTETTWIGMVFTVFEPGQSLHWDDLMGEAREEQEVRKARESDIEYFKQIGVYQRPCRQHENKGTKYSV